MNIRQDILELFHTQYVRKEGATDRLSEFDGRSSGAAVATKKKNSFSLCKDTFQNEMEAHKICNANVTQAHRSDFSPMYIYIYRK
jgi:hypothetical protein